MTWTRQQRHKARTAGDRRAGVRIYVVVIAIASVAMLIGGLFALAMKLLLGLA